MTALPRAMSAPGKLDWTMLVEIGEAARLVGKSVGHLRRLAAEELAGRGMAVHIAPPSGGNARWWIDRRGDIRLAPGATGAAHQAPRLDQFPESQRRRALLKVKAVERLRDARAGWPGKVEDWLPLLIEQIRSELDLKVTRASLYRWDKDYKAPADLVKLIDRRGGDQKGEKYEAAWAHAKQILLDPREPSYRDVFRLASAHAKAKGLPFPGSYQAFMRQLDKQVPPEVRDYHRKRRRWRRQGQPTIETERHAWAPGTCWEGDHRQFNFWVMYNDRPIRPWLTAWIDRGSRKLAGYAICPEPNSSTILAAMRHGLMDPSNFGGPDAVWIDNGKDYDSVYLHGRTKAERKSRKIQPAVDETIAGGLFNMFDPPIDAHFAIPHNPNGKPLIERWFETVESFDKSFVSYCGRNPQDKPEGVNELLQRRNWRKLPQWDHVVSRFADYLAGYNATAGMERDSVWMDVLLDGMSPEQYLREHCPRHRRQADASVLDLLLHQHHKPVRVGRNGVAIAIGGERIHYGQFNEALMPLKPGVGRKGQLVRIAHDPHDVSSVRVYDMQWQFICEAQANVRTNGPATTEAELREAMREKRAYERALKQVKQGRHYEYTTPLEEAGRNRRKEGPLQPHPDTPLKLVRTPLDDQSETIQKAQQRKAAGAENLADADMDIDLDALTRSRPDHDDGLDLDELGLGDEPLSLDFSMPPATFAGDDADDTDVDLELNLAPSRDDVAGPDAGDEDDDAGHILDSLQ